MSDLLGMDPGRIERLRSPERLTDFDPERVWDVVTEPDGPIVDIGCGVGFLTLPFARRLPAVSVYGCDVLQGMVGLLEESARAEGLTNLRAQLITSAGIGLPNDFAALVCMAQVHHELDDPDALLAQCYQLMCPGGAIVIIDWKDEENGKSPAVGRRVPEATIRGQLERAGFGQFASHEIYKFHGFLTATKPV
jgi:2-polyprenyl-3-methyl-5-hydroxy-6-metoxy-1,4-benzoquinol methylase